MRSLSALLYGIALAMALVWTSGAAEAGVSLKNGNFYVSYTDVSLPGRHALNVFRTYNSKHVGVGLFGFGWGSPWETALSVNGDGSITVHENGSGAETHYRPPKLNQQNLDAAVDSILRVDQFEGRYVKPGERARRRIKLLTDAEIRNSRWAALAAQGKLEARRLQVGTILSAEDGGKVVRTPLGYQRSSGDSMDTFDAMGRLLAVRSDASYTARLERGADGKLVRIVDTEGKWVRFSYNRDGLVSSLRTADGSRVSYAYRGKSLVWCERVEVEKSRLGSFKYTHDYDKNRKMTGIGYSDGTGMSIGYAAHTPYTSYVIDRVGHAVRYKYQSFEGQDPDTHYYTLVTKHRGKEVSAANRYEYHIATQPDGTQYTQRTLTVVDGMRTETEYSTCKLPLKIKRGKRETTFRYNSRCKLTRKDDGYKVLELEYWRNSKISRVKESVKGVPGGKDVRFQYSPSGNLVRAEDQTGTWVELIYDSSGEIVTMRTNDKTLKLKYNKMGKPIEITIENVGSIHVRYDSLGEIVKVDSNGGHVMSMQVTQAFQQLLTLVKPAGVNLGF